MMIPKAQRPSKIQVCLAAEAPLRAENPVLRAMYPPEILGNPSQGQQLSVSVLEAFLLEVLIMSFGDLQWPR